MNTHELDQRYPFSLRGLVRLLKQASRIKEVVFNPSSEVSIQGEDPLLFGDPFCDTCEDIYIYIHIFMGGFDSP